MEEEAIYQSSMLKHLEELVERNPTIKPAEALRNLKAALCLPHPLEHDKAIKSKVSSLKIKSQRELKQTFCNLYYRYQWCTCMYVCIDMLFYRNSLPRDIMYS